MLVSEELYRTGDAPLPGPAHEVSQDLEGIGPVRAYFVDVADLEDALPPLPAPSWLGRLGRTLASPAPACRTCSACVAGVPPSLRPESVDRQRSSVTGTISAPTTTPSASSSRPMVPRG